MDDMVGLGGEHGLHIVPDVAQNDSVTLAGLAGSWLGGKRLRLQALEDGDREPAVDSLRIVEDGPGWRCQSSPPNNIRTRWRILGHLL